MAETLHLCVMLHDTTTSKPILWQQYKSAFAMSRCEDSECRTQHVHGT